MEGNDLFILRDENLIPGPLRRVSTDDWTNARITERRGYFVVRRDKLLSKGQNRLWN